MSWHSRSDQPPYETGRRLDHQTLRQLGTLYRPNEKEKPLSDFTYTHSMEDIDSSAVDAAYYNIKDKTLAVALNSEEVYLYHGVPSWVWTAFENAGSKGSYYSLTIKKSYGPSSHLGNWWNIDIDPVEDDNEASVTPIRKPTFPLAAQPGTVGTPKGLTYASDAQVTTSAPAFVNTNSSGQVLNKHRVVFVVDGTDTVRAYNVDATGVAAAMDALAEATDALGIEVTVKEVTVYFE